eukprot:scaffold131754_cov54-Phaeocystis_antarctica.AAC.2
MISMANQLATGGCPASQQPALACSSSSTRQRRRDQAEAAVAGAMAAEATATALEPVTSTRPIVLGEEAVPRNPRTASATGAAATVASRVPTSFE